MHIFTLSRTLFKKKQKDLKSKRYVLLRRGKKISVSRKFPLFKLKNLYAFRMSKRLLRLKKSWFAKLCFISKITPLQFETFNLEKEAV